MSKILQHSSPRIFKRVAILGIGVVLLGSLWLTQGVGYGQSTSELQQRTKELQKQIEANTAQAEELEKQADSLKNTIAGLDLQIIQAQQKIELTDLRIAELQDKLEKTQIELDRQKNLLKASMRTLYKKRGASTVELLAASESFSKFIDEQEYLERLKSSIQESAKRVVELKAAIEKQKQDQEELQQQQKAAKRSLDESRAQRQQLLDQTQGEEARYRGIVADLQQKRKEVEEELTRRFLAGRYVSLGRVEAGQLIGRIGMTGFTFGPHLHFEYRDAGYNPVNPMPGGSLGYGMTWPAPGGGSLSQGFGCGAPYNWYVRKCGDGTSLHAGLDITGGVGSAVVAAKSGTIIHRGDDGDGYGIKVVILHDDGSFSLYAHLSP